MATILLLTVSNVFMVLAWYGHLKFKSSPLWLAIFASWGIAFVEYCFQVPANRIGHGRFTAPQLKVIQEVITLVVFGVFSALYLREHLQWNDLVGFALILAAVFFVFGFRAQERGIEQPPSAEVPNLPAPPETRQAA
ncbi:MAG TPA: DMT family protein [Planctomycetaceae bacterium]|nr:DMT family protein [Planctomycetaceae bacterium]